MIIGNNSSMLLQMQAFVAANLAAVTPGPAKIHLVGNNFASSQETKLSDMTEPTFTGYAAVAVSSWSGPNYLGSGKYEVLSKAVASFTATAGPGPFSITGWYLADINGVLVCTAKFGVPFLLTFAPANVLNILPLVEWDSIAYKNDLNPVP